MHRWSIDVLQRWWNICLFWSFYLMSVVSACSLFFFSISSVRDKAFVVALKPYSQLQWWNGGCTNCHSWLDVERFRNCVQSDRNTRHIKLFTLPSIFSKNGIFRNRIFVVSAYMRCTIVKRKIRLKLMCIQKEFVWWFGMDMTGFLVQLTHYRTINRLTSMETTEKSPHTHVKCLTLFQSSANAYFIKKKRVQPWILLQHPLPPFFSLLIRIDGWKEWQRQKKAVQCQRIYDDFELRLYLFFFRLLADQILVCCNFLAYALHTIEQENIKKYTKIESEMLKVLQNNLIISEFEIEFAMRNPINRNKICWEDDGETVTIYLVL